MVAAFQGKKNKVFHEMEAEQTYYKHNVSFAGLKIQGIFASYQLEGHSWKQFFISLF
jgi:hypothetical protein